MACPCQKLESAVHAKVGIDPLIISAIIAALMQVIANCLPKNVRDGSKQKTAFSRVVVNRAIKQSRADLSFRQQLDTANAILEAGAKATDDEVKEFCYMATSIA